MGTLRVTLDTNVLDDAGVARLETAAQGLSIEYAYVTVSAREYERFGTVAPSQHQQDSETAVRNEAQWGQAFWGGTIPESFVIGESRLGRAVLARDDQSDLFEAVLHTVCSGSFPKRGSRGNLSDGQRRQLRDAMILLAHVREGRDILVTDDKKAFIARDGTRREQLESLCKTRIMTLDEFCAHCASLARGNESSA